LKYSSVVQRLGRIFLLVSFAAMSSGLMKYLHELEHLSRPGVQAAGMHFSQTPSKPAHDENDCAICMTLHAPLSFTGYTPVLVFLGLFVAFLTLLPRPFTSVRLPLVLESRGPPSL
jgi:hypothetical protein